MISDTFAKKKEKKRHEKNLSFREDRRGEH
jgi:hypothetical protein